MTDKKGPGEFHQYVEANLGGGSSTREDLYFSARTSTLMGVVILIAGLVFGIEFLLLSGVIMVAIGLVLFVFLLDDYLRWKSYHRKIAVSNLSGP